MAFLNPVCDSQTNAFLDEKPNRYLSRVAVRTDQRYPHLRRGNAVQCINTRMYSQRVVRLVTGRRSASTAWRRARLGLLRAAPRQHDSQREESPSLARSNHVRSLPSSESTPSGEIICAHRDVGLSLSSHTTTVCACVHQGFHPRLSSQAYYVHSDLWKFFLFGV